MAVSQIFDLQHQLAFYGAYHTNRINILIHVVCVPLILWSAQVLMSGIPLPDFVPSIHYTFNPYLIFDLNFSAILSAFFLAYYYALEPLASLIYTPLLALSLLTATALTRNPNHTTIAVTVHVLSWIAQFLGHGFAEKRAPALLDNLIGAVVLAPFFVHLEVLFFLGYKPTLRKSIANEIGKKVAKIRQTEFAKMVRSGLYQRK